MKYNNFIKVMKNIAGKEIIFDDVIINISDVSFYPASNDSCPALKNPCFELNISPHGEMNIFDKNSNLLEKTYDESVLIVPNIPHILNFENPIIRISFSVNTSGQEDITCIFKYFSEAFGKRPVCKFPSNILTQILNQEKYTASEISAKLLFLKIITSVADNILSIDSYFEAVNHDKIQNDILNFLCQNYQKSITLTDIADFVHLSERTISRIFKQKTSMSIIEKLTEIRINKAKKLLLLTDEPTYKISEAVGYENEYYFFKIFKKVTGITPLQFRQINK